MWFLLENSNTFQGHPYWSMLSVGMQRNLRRYKDMASQSEDQGRLRVACAELDRDPKNVYGPRVEFDKTSSLRTNGPALFLLSLDDLQQSWDRQELHRMLSIPERFLLMGHPAETVTAFASRAAAKRASGNGMHMLVMACLVAPMLLLADQAGVTSEGRPTPAATMEQLWDMAYEDLRATGSMGRVHRKQKVCSPRSRPTAAKRNVLRKVTAATGELIHSPRRAAAAAARAATGELIHSPTSTATAAKRNVQTTANPKQEADGKRRRLWGKTGISSKEGKPWADAGVSPESSSIVQPQLPPESSSIVPSIVQPQLPPESSSIVPKDGPQLPACRRAHPIQSPARAATGELIHGPTSAATAAKRNVQTTANPKQEADGKRRRLWGKTGISSKEGKPWADAGVSPESSSIVPLIVQPQLPPESSSIVPSIVQPQLPPESSSIVPQDGPQLPACRRAHPIQSPAAAAAGELIHSRSPRAIRRSHFGKLTGRRSCRCIAIDLD